MAQAKGRRNALEELRRKFRAALAWYGMTAEGFAETAGVVPYHLGEVLKGKRTSAPLLLKVATFIGAFERDVCQQAERAPAEAPVAKKVA